MQSSDWVSSRMFGALSHPVGNRHDNGEEDDLTEDPPDEQNSQAEIDYLDQVGRHCCELSEGSEHLNSEEEEDDWQDATDTVDEWFAQAENSSFNEGDCRNDGQNEESGHQDSDEEEEEDDWQDATDTPTEQIAEAENSGQSYDGNDELNETSDLQDSEEEEDISNDLSTEQNLQAENDYLNEGQNCNDEQAEGTIEVEVGIDCTDAEAAHEMVTTGTNEFMLYATIVCGEIMVLKCTLWLAH